MQRGSCQTTEFLISKYADSEASAEERAQVDAHVAGCDPCAHKLTAYMEVAAVFSDVPQRSPESALRQNLFSEINLMKAKEREAGVARVTRPAPIPARPQSIAPQRSFLRRFLAAASPFAAAGTAVFVLLAVMTMVAPEEVPPWRVAQDIDESVLMPTGVPTLSGLHVQNAGPPQPVRTPGASGPRTSSVGATVVSQRSPVGVATIELRQPTPVFESGDAARLDDWHVVRDPQFGYTVSYPPNWWTQVSGNTRQFYPWGPGGTRLAPYWFTMRVDANTRLLDAESANLQMFSGTCPPIEGAQKGSLCRRSNYIESGNTYDELYAFDAQRIYMVRLVVPTNNAQGEFQERWQEAQLLFSRMSASLALASDVSESTSGYGPVLFLSGTDLWALNGTEGGASPVTRGYGVKLYALSPDLRYAAFLATNDRGDPTADTRYLYLVDLQNRDAPQLLWSGVALHDLAWYGDRELVVIAGNVADGQAIYRLTVPREIATGQNMGEAERQLLVKLDSSQGALRGLAVSPDRQLITFLAPMGEQKGTDIYSVRPDGTDLVKILSHDVARPLHVGNGIVLGPRDQAIKTYAWKEGRLEYGTYIYDMLFTCGNDDSPTLWLGGSLYSAPGSSAQALDRRQLRIADSEEVQIVHVALSPRGKVAFTGFYNSRDERAEVLAGLWTADLREGTLINIKSHPTPTRPHGIADLQWSPDGVRLIYRETIPQSKSDLVSRYDGSLLYLMIELDPKSDQRRVLHEGR